MKQFVALLLVASGSWVVGKYVPDFTKPWMNQNDTASQRAQLLLNHMELADKLHLFHGADDGAGEYVGLVEENTAIGIPALNLNDGPQGFRCANKLQAGTSTAYPSGLTVGATWDVAMAELWGTAMGEEFLGKGANVQLGPGLCLARVPYCGRNFEYISGEDPYLGYRMVQPVIKGIQAQGVIANAKHYINNNQETNRTTTSANLDERTEMEMYVTPFTGAIEAGVGSVMCSYNKINGTWSCENPATLAGNLKQRSNFTGWVMSDWGATHSTSIMAGLDQEMPHDSYMGGEEDGGCTKLCKMVKEGQVPMSAVNASALRILTPMFEMGVFDRPQVNTTASNVSSTAHTLAARKLSAAATVLLQNSDSVLPITSAVKSIAVIGSPASSPVVAGTGSGAVVPSFVADPLTSIRNRMGVPGPPAPGPSNCSEANWVQGVDFHNTDRQTVVGGIATAAECCKQCAERTDSGPCNAFTLTSGGNCWMKADNANAQSSNGVVSGIIRSNGIPAPAPNCSDAGNCVYYADGSDLQQAQSLAAMADVTIVFAATVSGEGHDRTTLSLDNGADDLISGLTAATDKLVVAMAQPGAVTTPWRFDVEAIVASFMPGQEYGNALVDVLFGDVNPSGRLPLTFPADEHQVAMDVEQWPGVNNEAYYTEKLEVGYRRFDAQGLTPAFPFGHGLSYTTFEYDNIKADSSAVAFDVTNTGAVFGKEVPQLYLGFPATAGEPPKQLKGFQVVALDAGESVTVTLPLTPRDLSVWNEATHQFELVSGTFQAFVGASSRDLRLSGTFDVQA